MAAARRVGWPKARTAPWIVGALAGLFGLAAPGAEAATPAAEALIAFAGKGSPPKLYEVAGLWLTLSTGEDGDGVYHAVLNVRGPGAHVFTALGARNTDGKARFGVFRLDPGATTPQIVFTSHTSGAHCCIQVDIISYDGLRWRAVDAGASDSGLLSLSDKVGSAPPALVFGDDRFLGAFAAFADSRSPIRVFNFERGQLIDVGAAWRYKPLYLAEMARLRGECEQHGNGACAAYVADAARAGRFKEAWAVTLASYDRSSQWFPTSCDVPLVQESCPAGHEHKFSSYPQALAWFLADKRYTRR